MWKFFTFVFLLYNGAITISLSSEYDGNSFDDRANDAILNLLDPNDFDVNGRMTRRETTESPDLENWTGRWMPGGPNDPTPPPKIWGKKGGARMGKIDRCDDGKTSLDVDWNKSPVNYTCYGNKITPDFNIRPLLYNVTIPWAYQASHKCMNETIEYDEDIPLYGTHRPVYPVYGEYKFLPRQRWLHSMEHGAVVMLYHPCANPLELRRLKDLVRTCLRRHIISPYNLLEEDRPLALVTWGSRLTMSTVNPKIVRDFIRGKSLRGPEPIAYDGNFDEGLISRSTTITDFLDSTVCPNM